jgi:hypothetical protein
LFEPRDRLARIGGFGGPFVHARIIARAGAGRALP